MTDSQIELQIQGMHCVSCAKQIEKSLVEVKGVKNVSVNFATGRASIELESEGFDSGKLIDAVHRAGYYAEVYSPDVEPLVHHHHAQGLVLRLAVSFLFTLPLLLQMIWISLGYKYELPGLIQLLMASVVQFVGGYPFYVASYHSLKMGSANMDLLIALGTTAAYGFSLVVYSMGLPESLYFESSATIITLILFGRWLEEKSKRKASEAIQKLLKLQPKTAKVERDGDFVTVPVSEIRKGDVFLVAPGENIPVDGVVLEGFSSVNEAMLTGESLPVDKTIGSTLFAATNNLNGVLKGRANKVGAETALAGIVRLVQQAQNSRAPIQKLADSIAEIFVPAVVVISILTFAFWIMWTGVFSTALINAVAVLIIACPCALGLATPVVILVASGRGATMGILFKEASAIQRAEKVQTIVLDKTGTLTEGKPAVDEVIPTPDFSTKQLLSYAYALTRNSTHPLSQAISELAVSDKIEPLPITDFQAIPGKGLVGNIDHERYFLGSLRFAEENQIDASFLPIAPLEQKAKTITLLWNTKGLIGCFALADRLRPTTKEAIRCLKELSINPVMLTGDHAKTASAVAKEVGINDYYAEVLPADKTTRINELKTTRVVGMVGDGINDAPALAAADIGFAIGAGSDIAMEASDVTLVSNDLMSVAKAIMLSKATMRKVKQNLFFAFIYNILGLPLAAIGLLNPVVAAAAMALSSLSVVINALLLKNWKLELPKN